MYVEDAAVLDTKYTPSSLQDGIVIASPEQRENLLQLVAVSAICNSAVMGSAESSSTSDDDKAPRPIIGDATGQ